MELSSSNTTSQLSSAILLRRFFVNTYGTSTPYRQEAINVISSLLRTLPVGILQKTPGDGLAYACDLTLCDLQKTNLQDLYIGKKNETIILKKTDFYMADLSYSLIENVNAEEVIFYNAVLRNCKIKNSNLRKANLANADLSNIYFSNVQLNSLTAVGCSIVQVRDSASSQLRANFHRSTHITSGVQESGLPPRMGTTR